jgi:hypothetical protein
VYASGAITQHLAALKAVECRLVPCPLPLPTDLRTYVPHNTKDPVVHEPMKQSQGLLAVTVMHDTPRLQAGKNPESCAGDHGACTTISDLTRVFTRPRQQACRRWGGRLGRLRFEERLEGEVRHGAADGVLAQGTLQGGGNHLVSGQCPG